MANVVRDADLILQIQIACALASGTRKNFSAEQLAEIAALEADPPRWLKHYFPSAFTRDFTRSQLEYIKWVTAIEPGEYFRPVWLCDPRGLGKSTLTRALIVYLLATRRREFVVIISGNDKLAMRHFSSVKRMLENQRVLAVYPHLAPQIQAHKTTATSWSMQRLVCDSGATVEVSSILGSIRGFANEENRRPDFYDFTDIDDAKESIEVTNKKADIIAADFLPALSRWGSCVGDQNLIHRHSIAMGVLDGSRDLLNDRRFIGPNPLMKFYDAKREPILDADGHPDGWRWVITSGEPFDPATPISVAETELNKSGRIPFERECQQNVQIVDEECDFREWDEIFHVCTIDEVRAGFNRAGAALPKDRWPELWEVGDGLDWGTTPGHPSAYSAFTRPDARYPFDDVHMGIIERCAPHFPLEKGEEAEKVSPRRVARMIRQAWREIGLIQEPKLSRMSHEASAAMNAFLLDIDDEADQVFFRKWKAQKGSGVPAMQSLMEIDRSRPHPFRIDPRTGEPLMGYTRFILVVAKGQGELYLDAAGILRVKSAIDCHGFARARFEIPLYSHRNQRDKKKNDDWMDGTRGCLADFAIGAADAPTEFRVEERLHRQFLPGNLPPIGDPHRDDVFTANAIQRDRIAHEIEDEERERGQGEYGSVWDQCV